MTTPNGGLHVWLRLPRGERVNTLLRVRGVRLDIISYQGGECPNVVLPGSVVRNRAGELVEYRYVDGGGFAALEAGAGSLDLPEPSDAILSALTTDYWRKKNDPCDR